MTVGKGMSKKCDVYVLNYFLDIGENLGQYLFSPSKKDLGKSLITKI